ncbi:MAG: hypothetical protein NDJ24_07435 [Alphaproteobacteria bacterium]|nr:hypothetical protein [Alphaproteobacteria bacterium]
MARRHTILLDEVPADLAAVAERIEQLTAALGTKRETKGLSKAEDREWSELLDYWVHVEALQGKRKGDEDIATDPLALLVVAERFNLAAPQQIQKLREHFTRQASRIVGVELSPAQVKKLHHLLRTFNPAQPR